MAMDGNALGTATANVIIAPNAPPAARAQITELWQRIAAEIVAHIQDNAEVPPGIAVMTPDTINGATSEAGRVA